MKYALTGTKFFTTQQNAVENYGDEVWEWVCDTFPDKFSLTEIAEHCPALKHLSIRTRWDYARVVLANVTEENALQGNPPPFKKRGKAYIWL